MDGGAVHGANAQLAGQAAGQPLALDQMVALQQSFVNGFRVALAVCSCVAAASICTSLARPDAERGVGWSAPCKSYRHATRCQRQ
jgi:hypothetical protein